MNAKMEKVITLAIIAIWIPITAISSKFISDTPVHSLGMIIAMLATMFGWMAFLEKISPANK